MSRKEEVLIPRFGIFLSTCALVFLLSQAVMAVSSIEGYVYDNKGGSLQDIHVELLNEYGSSISRARTDGAGYYSFQGLHDGRYAVRVRPFQHDFYEQQRPVQVWTQNIRGGEGSGTFQADFVLMPRKAVFADKELGVIFAQEVPKDARKNFESALESLRAKKNKEGFDQLQAALKIFPDYFDALHAVGLEFYNAKMYKEAIPYFLKASEVNAKSVTSLYYTGLSLHYLGKEYNKAALNMLKKAETLAPGNSQILFGRGMVERSSGDLINAETHLLAAKKNASSPTPEIHKELSQLYGNDLKQYAKAADELELYIKSGDLGKDEERGVRKTISSLRQKAKN